jgi:hypothetical protein
MVPAAVLAQAKKTTPKPFTPPPDIIEHGYVFGGPLLKDSGCARDYVKSQTMEGVEKRKFLAEMISYGCGAPVLGVYAATVKEPISLTFEKKTIRFLHVFLIKDDGLSFGLLGQDGSKATATQEGWMPDSEFMKISRLEAAGVVMRLAESKK